MESTSAWVTYEGNKIREGFASRETDPDYPALVEQARVGGFVPAPLNALLATGNERELYTWRGRVWVKAADCSTH
jgi:hypothetical protein